MTNDTKMKCYVERLLRDGSKVWWLGLLMVVPATFPSPVCSVVSSSMSETTVQLLRAQYHMHFHTAHATSSSCGPFPLFSLLAHVSWLCADSALGFEAPVLHTCSSNFNFVVAMAVLQCLLGGGGADGTADESAGSPKMGPPCAG
jgi:hypothetical protein